MVDVIIICVYLCCMVPLWIYMIHKARRHRQNLHAHQEHFEQFWHEAMALQNLYDPALPLPPIDDNEFED